jgi:hypothetical protein
MLIYQPSVDSNLFYHILQILRMVTPHKTTIEEPRSLLARGGICRAGRQPQRTDGGVEDQEPGSATLDQDWVENAGFLPWENLGKMVNIIGKLMKP